MTDDQIYVCPLTCGREMTHAELSRHLAAQADRLATETSERYARLGVPESYAYAAWQESVARFALAYRVITGELPAWADEEMTSGYSAPDWAVPQTGVPA